MAPTPFAQPAEMLQYLSFATKFAAENPLVGIGVPAAVA
jgi:hypothetical protein